MTKKKKYYVIWKGLKTGIFDSWDECKKHLSGFEGSQFRSFSNLASAQEAFKIGHKKFIKSEAKKEQQDKLQLRKKVGEPNYLSISVDAAASGNPGVMEYRGVDTKTKKELFKQGPFNEGTNNIGEFLAIVHALAFLKEKRSDYIIYSDSKTAISWVKKKICKTKLKPSPKNDYLFSLINRALFWLNNNHFTTPIVKWETKAWGEIPADFGRK